MEPQAMQQLQEMQKMQMAGAGIGVGGIIFLIIVWLFFAFCMARLAKNMGMPFGSSFVWALIPIANAFLMLKLGDKPWWWFFLFLIPIVNFVVAIMLWMAIAEKQGRPGWWGIMIVLVPFANIVFFLMLVFGQPKTATTTM